MVADEPAVGDVHITAKYAEEAAGAALAYVSADRAVGDGQPAGVKCPFIDNAAAADGNFTAGEGECIGKVAGDRAVGDIQGAAASTQRRYAAAGGAGVVTDDLTAGDI
ncbi:MAG: hypothetical protein LC802_23605 [Acidobacteria bacterium]|nr:hypothetical protein [Acidobacteriota bacterium]